MPGVVTMKPGVKGRWSGVSKAMARAREERGFGALLSQVRASPGKKGRRAAEVQQAVDKGNVATLLRMKLLREDGDGESAGDEVGEREPSSVRLAAMVDEFLEEEIGGDGSLLSGEGDSPAEDDESKPRSLRDDLCKVLRWSEGSLMEEVLLSEVSKAVKDAGGEVGTNSMIRRVVRHLRRSGHDAGVCKSRWDQSGGFPGGDYEYVDVVFEGASGKLERIVIDVDFKAQFEIARPTAHYGALVQALPSVFVGTPRQLHWIVNVMSDAVKLSLKKRGMHLAPWRKPEYIRAKWFSLYKRTTSGDETSDVSSEVSDVSHVANQSVGNLESVLREEKPVVQEPDVGKRFAFVDNNDWHPPILKAKKSQAPGRAGLASLFKEASLRNSVRKDQLVKAA